MIRDLFWSLLGWRVYRHGDSVLWLKGSYPLHELPSLKELFYNSKNSTLVFNLTDRRVKGRRSPWVP